MVQTSIIFYSMIYAKYAHIKAFDKNNYLCFIIVLGHFYSVNLCRLLKLSNRYLFYFWKS